MDIDIKYAFKPLVFLVEGKKGDTGFHKFSDNNSHQFQYWHIDNILQTVTSSGD